MRRCVLLMLCLLVALIATMTVVAAQDDDADDGDKPKFFFEKGGDLKPTEAPKTAPDQPAATVTEVAPIPEVPAPSSFDFEAADQLVHWSATDNEAILDILDDEDIAHAGDGCLRLTFMGRANSFQQLQVRPLTDVDGDTLRLSVQTTAPTNISFGVVERGGAFYQQFLATPSDEWAEVAIPLSSLVLSQDTVASDANLRLDVDQITEIRVQDLSNLGGDLGDVLGRKVGAQQIFLDDVEIMTLAQPPIAGDPLLVDDFEGNAIHVLACGGPRLELAEGAEGDGLSIICDARKLRWMGVVLACGFLDLAEAESIALKASATASVTISVECEEWDGSMYGTRVKLDPDAEWADVEVPLDEMILAADSDDENPRLDLEEIRVVVVVADTAGVDEFPLTIGLDDVTFK